MGGGAGEAWGSHVTCPVPPGRPISLTVAKCWDPTPRSYFTVPRGEWARGLVGGGGAPAGPRASPLCPCAPLSPPRLFLHLSVATWRPPS